MSLSTVFAAERRLIGSLAESRCLIARDYRRRFSSANGAAAVFRLFADHVVTYANKRANEVEHKRVHGRARAGQVFSSDPFGLAGLSCPR
jgi:hypothetical protein